MMIKRNFFTGLAKVFLDIACGQGHPDEHYCDGCKMYKWCGK